ncbi:hypothetical protein A7985_06515 [Pseudoalteromonas luteoviolacea]|uniref:Uncharacterized protein n=1 Tax=Pseudoalteromonas luteoviolacea TaxID=43657 RepID=A0A1C0TWA1_9GAMM|nr:hypothetical protein A7985_06515 [Pseudoalteromonas luteoviolacea]
MGYLVLGVFIFIHFYISFLACSYFAKSYEQKLNSASKALITLFTGPLTFTLMMLVIFMTPLRNTEAGIMDGGLFLMFILFTPLFPIVSFGLVKLAYKFRFCVKHV